MVFVEPVTLTGRGIRLEPLERAHHDALEEAAADGELWRIRVSSVPEPGGMAGYIEQALASRAAGDRFPFAVLEEATGRVLGSTSFHDIAPAVIFSRCATRKLETPALVVRPRSRISMTFSQALR